MGILDDIKFIRKELLDTKREIQSGTKKLVEEATGVKKEVTKGVNDLKSDIEKTKTSIKQSFGGGKTSNDSAGARGRNIKK